MTPTARSLAYLRAAGFVGDVVERWLPRIERRKDFLGIGDIIAAHPPTGMVLVVQCTSLGNVSTRIRKAKANPFLASWLRCAGFECWGWSKRDGKWVVKRIALNGDDLEAVTINPVRRRGKMPTQATLFDVGEQGT